MPPNWELTSISCDDPDSTVDLGTATATFALSVTDIEAQSPSTPTITCTFANCIQDLVLTGEVVTGTRTYEACNTITAASFTIDPEPGGADIIFLARSSVKLADGFAVLEGADFTVEIDPGV